MMMGFGELCIAAVTMAFIFVRNWKLEMGKEGGRRGSFLVSALLAWLVDCCSNRIEGT